MLILSRKTHLERFYHDVKSSGDPSQDNSSTDSLYPPKQWGMKWDTEGENLVPIEHQYSLDDLYLYGDYDNVIRSEYGG